MLKLWLKFDLHQQCPQEFHHVFSVATVKTETNLNRKKKHEKYLVQTINSNEPYQIHIVFARRIQTFKFATTLTDTEILTKL